MKSRSSIRSGISPLSQFSTLKNILLVGMLLSALTANAATWYVKPTGSDANAGNSWAAAFLTVQKALASASSGDQIWVAAGTYYPDEGPGQTDNDLASSFNMKAGVAIYGGFPAMGNPGFGLRDWNMHVTTLSGDLKQDDMPNFVNNGDNAYHVVRATTGGITATSILDGFTVTAGYANGASVNVAGGGMLITNTSPKIENCLFTWNKAGQGGGMFIWSGPSANPTILNCTFSWNMAGVVAGAVRVQAAAPVFDGCVFSDNSASYSGGVDVIASTSTFVNCSFLRNAATGGYGGGLSINQPTSDDVVDKCIFAGNQASGNGGGINIISNSSTITNCMFLGNKASSGGGGINGGNGVYVATAINCTFSGNSAPVGGAVRGTTISFVLTNCVLWENSSEISGPATVSNSIVQGGYAGVGNLNVNPLFVSQPDHTMAPTTVGDLHLPICSPAIDAGTNVGAPADDLDGNVRPFAGTDVDMGAYEFQGSQQLPVATCQNVTVELNSAGNGGTSASNLNNSSTGCPPLVFTVNGLNNLNFTCSDVGANTYTLTVTDALSVTATCTAVVTVNDNVAPMALCQNVTVELNAAGTGNITPAQVNNGSLDACGIQNLGLSKTAFSCSDVGMNTVTLTVTDNNSNTSTCTAKVTVNDNVPPVPSCQNLTIELNGAGMASITPAQVGNSSSDACGIKNLGLSETGFKCVDVGNNTVTLTVTDNNNNTSTCTATITVKDNIPPLAVCQNIILDLNNSNNGMITPAQVNNGSTDNCGIKTMFLNRDKFTCNDLGANFVLLTILDNSDNPDTCTAKVTVTNDLEVFDVIGGTFCTDDVDATVSLSGSETGVSYQLKRNGSNTGAPVPGSGSPLDFGMHPTGSYTVVASSNICGNTAAMNGPAQVVAGPCNISVPNHCNCDSPDGRTLVTLKISALPNQNWTVKAVIGLYDINSPQAPTPPTPLAVGTPLNYVGGNMYTLDVLRLNDKGYWVNLTNGDTDLDVMVGNASW